MLLDMGFREGSPINLIFATKSDRMGYGEGGAGADIPGGATLNFDVEVVAIGEDAPPEENLFLSLDTNKDKQLSLEEITAYFKKQGQDGIPEGLMDEEDKNKDGVVSWEEFGGPKGDAEPKYE